MKRAKVLPHKGNAGIRRSKRSTGRSAADPKKCAVQPEIAVRVTNSRDSWGNRYAPAKIRVRRGCYRYLVWRDGPFKCEFYLGKIKILTPLSRSCSSGPGRGAGEVLDRRQGVQK